MSTRPHRGARRSWRTTAAAWTTLGSLAVLGCGSRESREPSTKGAAPVALSRAQEPFDKLSQYGLFIGTGATQQPAEGVIPYDLNSPLFSDYSVKFRFIRLPRGSSAKYRDQEVFDFPVGTVIAKTFAYLTDARDPSKGRRLIETRILERQADGWVGLPYVWNQEQTEALLELAGETADVKWVHTDGRERTNNHIIPNANQCKGCHKAGEMITPIGPSARQLNREIAYADGGGGENQLSHWTKKGALVGAPPPDLAPRLAVWDDPSTGSLDERARAWLESNCAHCHNPEGPARNSGLDLLAFQHNPTSFGVYKAPVAAGRGSGGFEYDIVPGRPDRSILTFRIGSTDPGIMMPELGKRLIHEEGLALVREWIASMPDPSKAEQAPRSAPRERGPTASASSREPGTRAEGARDGNRLGTDDTTLWKGQTGQASWWWRLDFPTPQNVGAILQVQGDHPYCLRNAPARYVWQLSEDGSTWNDLEETATVDERRIYRLHRLKSTRRARAMRLMISGANGPTPTLREVEFGPDTHAKIDFDPWAIVVSTTGLKTVPGEGADKFQRLAHACEGRGNMPFQNVWLGDFNEAFIEAEPRPLCAFLSGNFIDWCQQDRQQWRGTAEVLRRAELPIWASCGGAQGLAILAETGVESPWDCPQCRDPKSPRLPIYTHIAGSRRTRCGDYSGCVFERGPTRIAQLGDDPVFRGLPREFMAVESHCGQIEWPPAGWELIATGGPGSKTKTQCLRLKGHPVYAAQFHIELEGTAESSRRIMANFLDLAQRWQARGQVEKARIPGIQAASAGPTRF